MKSISIISVKTGRALYAGSHTDIRTALEAGIAEGVSFRDADLRRANLVAASLDGGDFTDADFSGANLAGANLSEVYAGGANFSGCNLTGACLAEGYFLGADFCGAVFGGTIIAGSVLENASFDTLSALLLPFYDVASLRGARFKALQGGWMTMNKPPVIIQGLMNVPLVMMDHKVLIGHAALDRFDVALLLRMLADGGTNGEGISAQPQGKV